MKHLKKLFIFALCAQAYTAEAALDFTPLNNMLSTLEVNVGAVVDQIKVVKGENDNLKNTVQILEGDKNEIVRQAQEAVQQAQAGSEGDVNTLNQIVSGVKTLNDNLLQAMGGGNQPQGDGNQAQNQAQEPLEQINIGPNVANAEVRPNQNLVYNQEYVTALNNKYGEIQNSQGNVSNANKQALIELFSQVYPNEPVLTWVEGRGGKAATLQKVYETAQKYGLA